MILEDITGTTIYGYRAPSWSVNDSVVDWFYPVLKECGYRYSSSVYPGKTFLYGLPNFPEEISTIDLQHSGSSITEFPVPVFSFMFKKFAYSGGFYLRFFPFWFIKHQISKMNHINNKPIFIYLHPREIDANQPKLKLTILEQFIQKHWLVDN